MKKKTDKAKFKIGFKIRSALIALTLIPIIALGANSYFIAQSKLQNSFKVSTQQTLSEINSGMNNYFDGLSRQINILSTNYDVQLINDKPDFEPFLMDLLKNFKENNNDIKYIYLGTTQKKMFIYPSSDGLGANYDPTTRPWYKQALDNKGKLIITELYHDATTKESTVTIAKAVEYNGNITGVVAMDVDMNMLGKKLSNSKIGKQGFVFIADKNGTVISHPDGSQIGTSNPTKEDYWKDASSSNNGFVRYTSNGIAKYTTFTTNEEIGWKIIGTVEEKEFMDDVIGIRNSILLYSVIAAILSIIVSIALSRWITKNIALINSGLKKASEGELTAEVKIKSKDEFGELGNNFNYMVTSISKLIKNVQNSSIDILNNSDLISKMSEEVTTSINEMASEIDSVASGAADQTKDMEDGVKKLEGLGHQIDKVVELAEKMDQISKNADTTSKEGSQIVTLLLETSGKTKITTSNVAKAVLDMSKTTEEIGTITNTINSIAEQTNLLALNAAIEAARAGDSGRGFAVVADEIRQLAEQSTEATKGIQKLVEEITSKSNTAVNVMSEAHTIMEEQNHAVESTGSIFGTISEALGQLISQIKTIEATVNDTNVKKDEVIGLMYNISAVSEESAASSQQVSASTEEISAAMAEFMNDALKLKDITLKLQDEINKFKFIP